MIFKTPLIPGILLKRYKRFLADVRLTTGEEVVVHCPNSGSLLGATDPQTPVWVSYDPSPQRKLSHTWQLAWIDETYVGVNTQWPNELMAEWLTEGLLKPLRGYPSWRREVRYGDNTRFDFCLMGSDQPPCYVEVKNVHMKREGRAEFPDSVTQRGAKHLKELSTLAQQGARAVMVYIIQRNDCEIFTFANDLDPHYAKSVKEAREQGVEFYAYTCDMSPKSINFAHEVEVKF